MGAIQVSDALLSAIEERVDNAGVESFVEEAILRALATRANGLNEGEPSLLSEDEFVHMLDADAADLAAGVFVSEEAVRQLFGSAKARAREASASLHRKDQSAA